MSLNFVIYEKATGRIVEQRSAGGCFTESQVFNVIYGGGATEMLNVIGAIPVLAAVEGNGSVKVDLATLQIVPDPTYVAPPQPVI